MIGEAVEEAVLDSMLEADAVRDLGGRTIHSLKEFL